MADGNYKVPVDMTAADPGAPTADFLPLDNSDSHTQDAHEDAQDDDGSASDVSMAAESDDDEEYTAETSDLPQPRAAQSDLHPPAATIELYTVGQEESIAKKRKSIEDAPVHDNGRRTSDSFKKVKMGDSEAEPHGNGSSLKDPSFLPAEVWHAIFGNCPPKTLGSLLLVCRLFNVYLDPSSTIQCERPLPLSRSSLPILKPNAIWQASRRRFWPGMPSPLQDKTELYMWQLSLPSSCQHCGATPGASQGAGGDPDPWQSGPGRDGVAIIWAFATRSCGTCLLSKSVKEIDILLSSSTPSTLMAALPFMFVTQGLQAVTPAVVEKGQPPGIGPLTKLYWSSHVDDLKQEFFSVKAMGPATAEEWLKGLNGRGLERRNDALRWEKWASTTEGLGLMRSILYPGNRPPAVASLGNAVCSTLSRPSALHIPGLGASNDDSRPGSPSIDPSQWTNENSDRFRRSSSGAVSHSGRYERTKEEVAGLKAARKAEIERRALALDPPLPPNILVHIPSFQAALQIITPLDEQGWELLKPRLLAQKSDAERRERENAARTQKELSEKRNSSVTTKEARETDDADWDEVQRPVRARIAGFADEIIRDGWEDGDKVNTDTCPKFAVEVLTYIRKRFYAEVAKDAAVARAAGKSPVVDAPQGPYTQKLTLENMKWIFEMKVKPHTERYRKEIFLCNGCEVTVRYYGFEGVIQHYAAKHTHALSIGNVVVHWRAEWPEHPPFTWERKPAKTSFYPGQPPGTNGYQPLGPPQQYQSIAVGPGPPPGPPPPLAYAPPSWSEAYSQGTQAPYPATTGGYAPSQGYQAGFYSSSEPSRPFPATQAQQSSFNGPAQSQTAGSYSYNYGTYQSNSQIGYQPPPFSNQHTTHLEEMARMARELWNATSNMKDTLSIVRVQVVIYHLAKRFHAKFASPLPLSTFIDGLSNHKDMRPVRNVNGLICRVCHQGIGGYVVPEEERKSWSLPQLTSHFQSRHVEHFMQLGQYGQPPEWTVEMVMLPEPAAVSNLRAAIGTDGLKYHLVNEAVPHLLEASGAPQAAAPNGQSMWHEQTGIHHGVAEGPASYYSQSKLNDSAQDHDTGQFQEAAGAAPQLLGGPAVVYPYTEPPPAGSTDSALPAENSTPPAVTVINPTVPLSHSDDGGSRSSQGYRGGRDQHSRYSKKNKKKGGNNRDISDEEVRKRTEEEQKMAEEEAEREADVIRAMWAADRANAAGKTLHLDGDKAGERENTGKSGHSSKPSSKPGTPKQRNRFQSRPPRNSPRKDERASPLVSRELSQAPPAAAQRDAAHRGHQLSNVTYVDNTPEDLPRREWPQTSGGYGQYNTPPLPPPDARRRGSRSPIHMEYGRPPPVDHYRQRTPPRQPGEPLRQSRDPILMDERGPRPQDDRVPREYLAPQGDLIEIEIIEYRRPDGTVWIEERPIRRIPNTETERFYRDAPPPPGPAAYDRAELPLPPGPYHRRQPPGPATDEPILLSAGSFHRGQPARPAVEHYPPPHDRAYQRAPPLPPSTAESSMYDPRYPSDTALRRNDPAPHPPLSQNAQVYYEEEYDPRFPVGPPGMPAHPPRTTRY